MRKHKKKLRVETMSLRSAIRPSRRDALILLVLMVIFFVSSRSRHDVVNYPFWLSLASFLLVFVVMVVAQIRKIGRDLSEETGLNFWIYVVIGPIKYGLLSLVFSGALLMPYNYYNYSIALKSPAEYVDCEVMDVGAGGNRPLISYVFKGKRNTVRLPSNDPVVKKVQKDKDYGHYWIVVKMRKGFFDSYIIEDFWLKGK